MMVRGKLHWQNWLNWSDRHIFSKISDILRRPASRRLPDPGSLDTELQPKSVRCFISKIIGFGASTHLGSGDFLGLPAEGLASSSVENVASSSAVQGLERERLIRRMMKLSAEGVRALDMAGGEKYWTGSLQASFKLSMMHCIEQFPPRKCMVERKSGV